MKNLYCFVILSEAKDLLFAGAEESGSFASLRMTTRKIIIQTVPETAHHPEKTAECRRLHTS
jgi:hypothetical protein